MVIVVVVVGQRYYYIDYYYNEEINNIKNILAIVGVRTSVGVLILKCPPIGLPV